MNVMECMGRESYYWARYMIAGTWINCCNQIPRKTWNLQSLMRNRKMILFLLSKIFSIADLQDVFSGKWRLGEIILPRRGPNWCLLNSRTVTYIKLQISSKQSSKCFSLAFRNGHKSVWTNGKKNCSSDCSSVSFL